MRYIADSNGYVKEVSFGADIVCDGQECTEYTGAVPTGYASLEAWFMEEIEKLYRWKIVGGNLTLDSAAVAPFESSGKSAITVYKSAAQTLTASAAKVEMGYVLSKRGDVFSLSNGGVLVNKSGWIEVSGQVYVGSGLSVNDTLAVQLYRNSTNIGTIYTGRATYAGLVIAVPTITISVNAGDHIYFYAYNSASARGSLLANLNNRLTVRDV